MMSPDSQRLAVALLGAFPPDRNGVAIHNLGLANGLGLTSGAEVSVVRTGHDNPVIKDSRVVSQLRPRWQAPATEALRALNAHDLVLIQQDFCSFGCDDGREVLEVIDSVEVPVITTVHHVPVNPSIPQLHVLEGIVQRSDCVVVPSQSAAARLGRYFPPETNGDETSGGSQPTVFIIPRGAIGSHTLGSRRANGEFDPTRILTPGFLRPGKGIEWAIEAFAAMNELIPALRYVVAGPDLHPDAAAYRRMLMQLAAARGLGSQVIFDDRFLSPRAMAGLISTSAAVLLPYDDLGRESSSVLIDALSLGTPVISSKFEFATELLSGGGGVLVDHDDPVALAAAIESVVVRPHLRNHQGERALAISRGFAWRSIAQSYLRLGTSVIAAHRRPPSRSPNGNTPQGVLTAV
jgi:glycosyltransferase involved in cell wall biosynthesis